MNYKLQGQVDGLLKSVENTMRAQMMGYVQQNLCNANAPKSDAGVPQCCGCKHFEACAVWLRSSWAVEL